MKAYGGVAVQLHEFLTLETDGGAWSASYIGHFTSREQTPGTHYIKGWVRHWSGLEYSQKMNNSCPAMNQILVPKMSSL